MTPDSGSGSDQLLVFIKYLRGRDIPISPADSLDAVHVASLIGYQDREQLKHGLAAVLAKSRREAQLFNAAFDNFFSIEHSAISNGSDQANSEAQSSDATQTQSSENTEQPSALAQLADESSSVAELMQTPLMEALTQGDEGALAVAIEAAAGAADIKSIRLFTQRGQYIRKLLDALGEQQLRDVAIELESSDQAAFDELQALRAELLERARDRVERAYTVFASGDTDDFLDEALSKVRLGNIAPHQMARLKKLLDRMARKLAARHGRRRRKSRRGQLNITGTLRKAVTTDGIPFEPRFRTIQRRRPQVIAICDVSGSVAAYAKFLLMFLYALQDVLPRTRSFAFSSNLGEVTHWFDELPVETAIERVNLSYGGATDYGRALTDFSALALQDINRSTTVIVLGDARNNDSDPRLDILADIKSRCKQFIWLNPETRRAWGSGDSEMLSVIRHCHIAAECNNLKQLERIVDKLLTDMHSR